MRAREGGRWKDHLSKADERAEEDGTPPHSEDTVNEVPTKDRENNVGPGVERVQELVVCSVNVHDLGGGQRGRGGRGGRRDGGVLGRGEGKEEWVNGRGHVWGCRF